MDVGVAAINSSLGTDLPVDQIANLLSRMALSGQVPFPTACRRLFSPPTFLFLALIWLTPVESASFVRQHCITILERLEMCCLSRVLISSMCVTLCTGCRGRQCGAGVDSDDALRRAARLRRC